jgi:hypothetical protein
MAYWQCALTPLRFRDLCFLKAQYEFLETNAHTVEKFSDKRKDYARVIDAFFAIWPVPKRFTVTDRRRVVSAAR